MELYGYIIALTGLIPLATAQNWAAMLGNLGNLRFGGDVPNFNMQMGGGGGGDGGGGGNSNCPYTAHPNRFKFNQMVNNRQMSQDCAPGTMFDQSKCSCVNTPKTSPGGGPMPGSNPRLQAPFGGSGGSGGGGGGGGDISQLLGMLQQLQGQRGGGGGGGQQRVQQQRRQPYPSPPPFRPASMPQMNTRGPGHNLKAGLSLDLGFQFPNNAQGANPIKYNPGLGLMPVVDPSILPDVLPPAVLAAVTNAALPVGQNKATSPPTSKSTTFLSPKPGQLPAKVLSMFKKATAPPPPRQHKKTVRKPNGNKVGGAISLPNKTIKKPAAGALSPNVLRMLQQANSVAKLNMPQPTSQPKSKPARRPNTQRSTAAKHPAPQFPKPTSKPSRRPNTPRSIAAQYPTPHFPKPTPKPTRRPNNPRSIAAQNPAPQFPAGGDPIAGLLAQLQAHMGRNSQLFPSAPPKTDPMGSLMSRIQKPSSRQTTRQPAGGAPDMSQLAALMGGGGGSGLNSMMGGPGLAALMGGLGNNLGNTGVSGGSGSPSTRGGMLDVNSFSGNLNVAALMGETPGPGLGQNLDMTSFFNTQGKMGAGGGLAGLQNLNVAKLQQLDRQGVIDIGDLSPAGLAAANAHFAG